MGFNSGFKGLKLHLQPLVLCTWRIVGRVVTGRCQVTWLRPVTTRPTNLHVRKTRGCKCSFKLLMMGGVSPKTRRASYKYEIKFWYTVASCWIFLNVNYTMMHGSTYITFTEIYFQPSHKHLLHPPIAQLTHCIGDKKPLLHEGIFNEKGNAHKT